MTSEESDSTWIPCFIPARFIHEGEAYPVKITKLATTRAQGTGSIPVGEGERALLELNRLEDGVCVRVDVQVTSVRGEGQQWGWKPAYHVEFYQELSSCSTADPTEFPLAASAMAAAQEAVPAAPGGGLPAMGGGMAGLGPRRRKSPAPSAKPPPEPDPDPEPEPELELELEPEPDPEPETQPADVADPSGDELAPVPENLRPPADVTDPSGGVLAPVPTDLLPTAPEADNPPEPVGAPLPVTPSAPLPFDDLELSDGLAPDMGEMPEGVAAETTPQPAADPLQLESPPPLAPPAPSEGAQVLEEPPALDMPIPELSPPGLPPADPPPEAPPQPTPRPPRQAPLPAAEQVPISAPLPDNVDEHTAPDSSSQIGVYRLDDVLSQNRIKELKTRRTSAPKPDRDGAPWEKSAKHQVPRKADPPKGLLGELRAVLSKAVPRRETVANPYEASPSITSEQVRREARILSEVEVHYQLGGDQRLGVAQDFSLQGLFLALTPTDPMPRLGAMLRLEFPIDLPDDTALIRMITEVRWAHGEDDPDAPGRGIGLQIATFQNNADRELYEAYVNALLTG